MSPEPAGWKACATFVAQTFLSAGSGDFPVARPSHPRLTRRYNAARRSRNPIVLECPISDYENEDEDDDELTPAYRLKYFTATIKSFGRGAVIVRAAPVSGCSMVNCSR